MFLVLIWVILIPMKSRYNPDIHHRQSIRLKDYDYSQYGYYYITICTKNRKCYFGQITNGKMELSQIGEIVCHEWIKTPQIRKNIKLDKWIVMPDHFHAIVVIENDNVVDHVGACRGMPLQQFSQPKSQSLSMIINHFKSAVKRWCNKNDFEYFQWQTRFYESIIRNKKQLNAIREYIINNPLKWELDRNYRKP